MGAFALTLASTVSAPYTGGSYTFSLGQICSLGRGTNAPESVAVPFPVPSHRHSPGNQGLRKFLPVEQEPPCR